MPDLQTKNKTPILIGKKSNKIHLKKRKFNKTVRKLKGKINQNKPEDFVLAVFGIKPRTLGMLGKHSTTQTPAPAELLNKTVR